jgi:26S proteasome regulatory subunit N2
VAGEGAGIGIGLLLAGRGPAWASEITGGGPAAEELLNAAHGSKHEKIIRAIGLGLGLMCYGVEEGADSLIRTLSADMDAVIR